MLRPHVSAFFLLLLSVPLVAVGEAPFIDAKAIKERFSTITPQDMDELRQRRILVISMSMGRNLVSGLQLLGKSEPKYNITGNMIRFDSPGSEMQAIPGDVSADPRLVHMIGVRRPAIRRVEQIEQLLRTDPWLLGNKVDIVMIIYVAEVDGKFFPTYQQRMEALRRDFPKTRFLHCTTSVIADVPGARNSKGMQDFSDQMRAAYRGKELVYDLGAILSDDFRNGPIMLAEYTKDSTGVHPDKAEGMLMMGRGFVLAAPRHHALGWRDPPTPGDRQGRSGPCGRDPSPQPSRISGGAGHPRRQ